jgi:hypothetical protein
VVEVAGVTVTFPVAGGLAPVLAVHTKGPGPLAAKAWLWPAQMVDKDGVMVTDEPPTVTVITAELTQVPTVFVTV